MAADKDIIVAIELGTTSIRGIAGHREPDGSMQILAVEQEHATGSIRKGIVDNIDKTTQAISRIVTRINDRLGVHITRVYVGLGGQSLHTCRNSVPRSFDMKVQITPEMVDNLKDINRGIIYPDSTILDVAPQEYRIGNRAVDEPVGMQSEHIEGHFVNVVARTILADNIERCVRGAGLELAEILITPLALADCVLTTSEKRSGCALVDMGADTTTVGVYTNNILRHLAVIPLGGNNITMDIANQNMEFEEAESLKKKYGTAYVENIGDGASHKVSISYDRTIEESALQNIVEARAEEIIANVWTQINEYSDRLLSGIVFTGAGARLTNLTEGFKQYTKCDSKPLRIVKGLPVNSSLAVGVSIPEDLCVHSLVSLLMEGDQNCVGVEPVPEEKEEQPVESVIINEPINEPQPDNDVEPEETSKAPKKSIGERFGKFGSLLKKMLEEGEE